MIVYNPHFQVISFLIAFIFPSFQQLLLCSKYLSFSFMISVSTDFIASSTEWFILPAIQDISLIFSSTTIQRHQFFIVKPPNDPDFIAICCNQESYRLDNMYLYCHCGDNNILSRFVIVFLPSTRCLFISCYSHFPIDLWS